MATRLPCWLPILVAAQLAAAPAHAERAPHSDRYFKLLSWNAYELGRSDNTAGYPYGALRGFIHDAEADIVTLQEVRRCAASAGGFYRLLRADNSYYHYDNMSCAESHAYPGQGEWAAGDYGIGFASLFPAASDKTFRVLRGRTVMGRKYRVLERDVWVFSLHVRWRDGPSDNGRRGDLQTAVDFIRSKVAPGDTVILTGDFNANIDERVPSGAMTDAGDMDIVLGDGYIDVARDLYPHRDDAPRSADHRDELSTSYTSGRDQRIDYVFVKNLPRRWTIGDVRVLDNFWCRAGKFGAGGLDPQRCVAHGNRFPVDHSPILVQIVDGVAIDLPAAVDDQKPTHTNRSWGRYRTFGDGVFYRVAHASGVDGDVARASDIDDGQAVHMEHVVVGSGTISFRYATSSASGDELRFSIDGAQVATYEGIHGGFGIASFAVTPPAGTDTSVLRWSYVKDAHGSAGEDTAYVDAVVWSPDSYAPDTAALEQAVVATPYAGLSVLADHDGFFVDHTQYATMSTDDDRGLRVDPELGDGGIARLRILTPPGEGTVSFRWRVSSERSFDILAFYVDGVEKARISGETGWRRYELEVAGAGPHVVEWRYSKDWSVSAGRDTAWLDEVNWARHAYIRDAWAGVPADRRLYWTGSGDDCDLGYHPDCKNVTLVDAAYAMFYAQTKWRMVPTRYPEVFHIEDAYTNSSYGGRLSWTSAGDDCNIHASCVNATLFDPVDANEFAQAMWRVLDAPGGFVYLDDRFACEESGTCTAPASRRLFWTGGGDDCQASSASSGCKNVILRATGTTSADSSMFQIEYIDAP